MPEEKPVAPKLDESKLTGEQQLELERLRAQRAESEKVIEELRAKDRDHNVKDTFKREVEKTGIRPRHTHAELVTLLNKEEGVVITPSGDGRELHVEKDGKRIEFSELLESYAVKHPNEFDGRTLRSLIDKGNKDAITSLEDLPTRADRIAYIAKFGEDAFGKLGQYKVPSLDASKLTANDWAHMTYAQKASVVEKHGQEIVSKILRRK
jgi:hypothetical protein